MAPKSRRSRKRWQVRRSAWLLCECLLSMFSYWTCGLPKKETETRQRMGDYRVPRLLLASVSQLFEDAIAVCRTGVRLDDTPGRGVGRLLNLLTSFSSCAGHLALSIFRLVALLSFCLFLVFHILLRICALSPF